MLAEQMFSVKQLCFQAEFVYRTDYTETTRTQHRLLVLANWY